MAPAGPPDDATGRLNGATCAPCLCSPPGVCSSDRRLCLPERGLRVVVRTDMIASLSASDLSCCLSRPSGLGVGTSTPPVEARETGTHIRGSSCFVGPCLLVSSKAGCVAADFATCRCRAGRAGCAGCAGVVVAGGLGLSLATSSSSLATICRRWSSCCFFALMSPSSCCCWTGVVLWRSAFGEGAFCRVLRVEKLLRARSRCQPTGEEVAASPAVLLCRLKTEYGTRGADRSPITSRSSRIAPSARPQSKRVYTQLWRALAIFPGRGASSREEASLWRPLLCDAHVSAHRIKRLALD